MRIEYHRTLIADRVRNLAFFEALKASIVPGETLVADIGTGTGLLGLMAAHLGARRVYMYETAAVGAVAERIVKANRAKVCELIAGHSRDMIDPPKVDVVVSETLGNYAFEENMIATLADAARRHLKPGGRLIPSALTQFVSPVTSDRMYRQLTAWREAGPALGFGLDLSPAEEMSHNNAYVRSLSPDELLGGTSAAVAWDEAEFSPRTSSKRHGEAAWPMARAATIHGFALWWRAYLAPGIALATGPADPQTHWEQLYLPLSNPMAAEAGTTLQVAISSRSSEEAGTHIKWTAVLLDKAKRVLQKQAHDLDKGYLP